MDKQPEEFSEDMKKKFSEMSRGEKRRIFKVNKKYLKGMSFTEFNKMLPKKEEQTQ